MSKAESIWGLMQLAGVRTFDRELKFKDILDVRDMGSPWTWVDDDLLEKLELRGEPVSLNVTGIHGTLYKTQSVSGNYWAS